MERYDDWLETARPDSERDFSPNSSFNWFVFGTVLSLAFLAFELTHDPAMAAMIVCLKFGWDDLLTARWFYKRDPDPRRGKAHFWFHMACAAWRVGIAAIVLTVILFYLAVTFRNQNLIRMFGGLRLVFEACFGVMVGMLLTMVAIIYAALTRQRVWIDSKSHQSRRLNEWPPLPGPINRAPGFILLTVYLSLALLEIAVLVFLRRHGVIWPRIVPGVATLLLMVFVYFATSMTTAICRQIAATSPRHVWK